MKKTAKQFTVRLLVLAMLVAFLPQAVIAANTEGTADLTITTLENLEDFLYKENEFNENTGVEKDAAAVVPDALPNLTPDESDTSKTTYLISSKDDMETLAEYINGGNSGENLTFKMTNNINLEGDKWDQWMPIGISDSQFCGTFDGAGYEISGLYIDNEDLYQGLFGDIGAGGIVQDLGVSGTITGSGFVGGITARLDDGGMIRNCHNAAEISCGFSGLAGGIVGHAGKATIEKCYNIGTVGGDFAFWIGGIVGMSESTVRNCYNTGTVFGSEWIGGIIGSNTATVENCYSIGTITGEFKAGGVTGSNSGSVENCFYLSGSADTSADGKALTEAQFAQRDTFTGWDFTDTWTMSSMLARPVLQNNTAGGAGTEKDPYIIPDLETLEQFRDAVNNGNTYEGKYVKLTADIDLNPGFTFDETGYSGGEGVPKQWTPIGLDTGKFSGVFDGGDHIIKGLYINETAGNGVGLFGWVDGGEIRNLTLENGLVNSKVSYTGGIVGSTDGIVKDCVNSVHIITESGNLHIGGIAGHCGSNSTLSGCRNTGSVSGGGYISGIVGSGEGKVENCSNTGNIAGGDINTGVAGIAGWARGMDIIDCYNTGNITSNNKNSYAGGIAGYCPGSVNILNCSSTGKVECLGIIVGGIAGYIPGGTVSACYNTGSVKGSSIVGGVVGYMTGGMVQNCYSTGAATGTVTGTPGADSITGGVIGFALKGTVENCYNNGTVTGENSHGGVFGGITVTEGAVSQSQNYYLDTCVSGGNAYGSPVSAARFLSGEVAWLLQDAQPAGDDGVVPRVWGQTVSGDTPDAYPVLTDDTAKSVLKVSFMSADGQDGEYTEYAAAYTNPNGTVSLPEEPESEIYEFERWSQTAGTDGDPFTNQTQVTQDISVYAVGREMYGETDGEKKIETTYGTAVTRNLSEYMTYAGETDASGKFEYTITGGNTTTATANGNTIAAAISGDTLTIPSDTSADTYTLTIRAKEITPVIVPMSVNYGTEPVTFTVTVAVNKAASVVTVKPAENRLTYTGQPQALVTAGTATGGTLEYALSEEGPYSTEIPKGTDADTYTVWYRVTGDKNHNDTAAQPITVTIEKADSETEAGGDTVIYGGTLTLTAAVSKAQTNGISLMAAQDKVEFFAGDTLLGTADVIYDTTFKDQGTATITINTVNKELFVGDNKITAVYGGSVNLNGSESDSLTVHMQAKPVEYTVTAKDKVYDGDTTVEVALTPANLEGTDKVTITANGSVSSADAGDYTSVALTNITLGGPDMGYYSVSAAATAELTEAVTIGHISENKPNTTIDYKNGMLTGVEDGAGYAINGSDAVVENGSIIIDDSWFGQTISIVKKASDSNHSDSAPQSLEVPARPAAPEGVSGGTRCITGVDNTMEYKLLSADEWTAVEGTTVTNLSSGTYQVRISATDTEFASETVSVTVKSSGGGGGGGGSITRYIVTFDTRGGSSIDSVRITRNNTVTEPAEPTREGYIFEGWFTDKDCTEAYDFDTPVTKSITLYAKWTEDTEEPDDPAGPSEPTDPSSPSDPAGWENPFADVDEYDWFYDAVQYAVENGLFGGMTETEFAPNEAITRSMLVTVLWRAEDRPAVNYLMTFKDVDQEAYYAEAVRWAASEGIVLGYSDEEFAPDDIITREQFAAILERYAEFKGIATDEEGGLSQFIDAAQISDWALGNMQWAVGAGLINGRDNGRLDPQGNTTRAETAVILQRFLEK